jgi:anti-sigma factor RsiW
MNCAEFEHRIISFVDGRLSASEREDLERHFAACASCRLRAAEYRRLWEVLEELPAVEASAAFDARLRQQVQAEAARKASFWGWLAPQVRVVLATGALLTLALVLVRMPRPDTTTQPGAGGGPTAVVGTEAPRLANSDEELKLLENLAVLEDYDILDSFEALSELPAREPAHKKM